MKKSKSLKSIVLKLAIPVVASVMSFLPINARSQDSLQVNDPVPAYSVSTNSISPVQNYTNENAAIYNAGLFLCNDGASIEAGADYFPITKEGKLFLDGRIGSSRSYIGATYRQDPNGFDGLGAKVRFTDHENVQLLEAGLEYFPNKRTQLTANGILSGTLCEEDVSGGNIEALFDFWRKEKSSGSGLIGAYSYDKEDETSSGIYLGGRLDRKLSKNWSIFAEGKFFSSGLFDTDYNVSAGVSYTPGKNKRTDFRPTQFIVPCIECKEEQAIEPPYVPEPKPEEPERPDKPDTPDNPPSGGDDPGNPVGNDGNTGTDGPGNPVGNSGNEGTDVPGNEVGGGGQDVSGTPIGQ